MISSSLDSLMLSEFGEGFEINNFELGSMPTQIKELSPSNKPFFDNIASDFKPRIAATSKKQPFRPGKGAVTQALSLAFRDIAPILNSSNRPKSFPLQRFIDGIERLGQFNDEEGNLFYLPRSGKDNIKRSLLAKYPNQVPETSYGIIYVDTQTWVSKFMQPASQTQETANKAQKAIPPQVKQVQQARMQELPFTPSKPFYRSPLFIGGAVAGGLLLGVLIFK